MKASSIRLAAAAALTFASLSSATAGVAVFPFPSASNPPQRMAQPPANVPTPSRFGGAEPNGFQHHRAPFPSFFPGGFGVVPFPVNAEERSVDAAAMAAPNVAISNISLVFVAPSYARASPPIFATAPSGPQIITIRPLSHWARSKKMPIVIYGSTGGRAY